MSAKSDGNGGICVSEALRKVLSVGMMRLAFILCLLLYCCWTRGIAAFPLNEWEPPSSEGLSSSLEQNSAPGAFSFLQESPVLELNRTTDRIVVDLQNMSLSFPGSSMLADNDPWMLGANEPSVEPFNSWEEQSFDYNTVLVDPKRPWECLGNRSISKNFLRDVDTALWYFSITDRTFYNESYSGKGMDPSTHQAEAYPPLIRFANLPSEQVPWLPDEILQVIQEKAGLAFSVFYYVSPSYVQVLCQRVKYRAGLGYPRSIGIPPSTVDRFIQMLHLTSFRTNPQAPDFLGWAQVPRPGQTGKARVSRPPHDFVDELTNPFRNAFGSSGELGFLREWVLGGRGLGDGPRITSGPTISRQEWDASGMTETRTQALLQFMLATEAKHFRVIENLREWFNQTSMGWRRSSAHDTMFGDEFEAAARLDYDHILIFLKYELDSYGRHTPSGETSVEEEPLPSEDRFIEIPGTNMPFDGEPSEPMWIGHLRTVPATNESAPWLQ